jgi:hypothetical protein
LKDFVRSLLSGGRNRLYAGYASWSDWTPRQHLLESNVHNLERPS